MDCVGKRVCGGISTQEGDQKEKGQVKIEDIRSIALKLPHATEDIKWGSDLCFCIAEKMFCVTSMEGDVRISLKVETEEFEGDVRISLKVETEEFEELCQRQGFIRAPYMARSKWVLIAE